MSGENAPDRNAHAPRRASKLVFAFAALALLASAAVFACASTRSDARPSQDEAAALASSAQLCPLGEPGEPMVLACSVLAPDGVTPLKGVRLRAYQTDHAGYYRRAPLGFELGPAHARLSAWLATDEHGCFELRSIRPAGYPDARIPAHVHVELHPDGLPVQEHTLYFEGDARLCDELREAVRLDGRGDVLPLAADGEGVWRCTWTLRAVKRM